MNEIYQKHAKLSVFRWKLLKLLKLFIIFIIKGNLFEMNLSSVDFDLKNDNFFLDHIP